MTVTVAHSTPADGTFSASGATAWNANHTLTGVGTMAEQDANNVNITGGSITGVTGVGTVTGVTGTAPITSSGGATPAIGIPKATTSVDGYLSATDWTTFNGKQPAGTYVTSVGATAPVTSSGGTTPTIAIPAATSTANGYLTSTDWTTFNNKLSTAVTSATAGTGMSVSASTGPVTFTNTAPDQVVALTAGTGINVSGTYPNFTIANSSPSLGGDVVGPASSTDNAVARFDALTGKLLQNSLVLIGDTGSVTGVNALTCESLVVNNNATLGSSNTDTLDVRSRISSDLDPETNNAKDIGSSGRNWRDGFFGRTLHTVNLELTGTTSFDGSQGTSGQVLTSQGTGVTPVWTTPTTGTVTSVTGTAPVVSSGGNTPAISMAQATGSVDGYLSATDWTTFNNKTSNTGTVTSVGGTGTVSGLSLSGTVTTTGNLTLGGALDLSSPPVIGGTAPNAITGTTITATTYVGVGGGNF